MTFQNLKFEKMEKRDENAIQAKAFFPNGYGVSIVKHQYSYGGPEGLYEGAVIKGNEEEWELDYTTDVTQDVKGWMSEDDVTEFLQQVESLGGINENDLSSASEGLFFNMITNSSPKIILYFMGGEQEED